MPIMFPMRISHRHSFRRALGGCLLFLGAAGCQSGARPAATGTAPTSGDIARNQEQARSQTDEAFSLIEKSQFDQAEDLLKKAVIADPLYGPAHNDLGLIDYHRQDFYDAAWEFENAAKLMPRQAPPVNNLGLVMESANKLADAEKQYSAALDLDADNPEYAGNLARVRIKQGKRDSATRKLLDMVIARDHRGEWVTWAREQASLIPGSGTEDQK